MNKKLIILITLIMLIIAVSGCAALDDTIKGVESDTKGLDRTVQVWEQGGELIFEGEGIIRVSNNDYGNKVIFHLDGKRYAFYNATVAMIEK